MDLAPVPDVSAVAVDPAASTVAVGAEVPLRAVVMDGSGRAISGASIVWSVRDPNIASVSTTGVVTGRAVGTTQVAASASGKSGTATITVLPPPVASVTVAPAPLSLTLGQAKQLSVVMKDAGGVDLTGRSVSWSSANSAVATVSADGVVTATGIGTTTITATSEGVSGGATVSVTPVPVATIVVQPTSATVTVGQTAALDVLLKDATGTPLDRTDRPVVWSSSDETVARVSATGLVAGVAPGSATITATSEGKSGSAQVTVTGAATPVPVGSVAIEPASVTLLPGASTTLTATVRDAAGAVLTDRAVSWTSSNILVAIVSKSGVITAIVPGSATISATAEGKSGGATVKVTLIPVGSIAVQPTTASVTVGQTSQLTTVVKDASGAVLTDRVVIWSSSNDAVARVSATGMVTGVAPGTATITVAGEGKSATALVSVTRAPVGSVVVPPSTSLAVGQTTSLAATVRDANGTIVTDRLVTWSSSNPAVATVDPTTGVVTGVSVGSVTITATSEGKSGSAAVAVTAVAVASVAVQPSTANLNVGQTAVLSATVTDANGTVVIDRPITWASSNPLVATVSATGVLTAVAPGSATINASAGGKSGAATVVVTLVPVGSVAVQPTSASVVAGQTTTLVATVRDANGAVVTDRPVSWTSSNTSVATVSASGVVTAIVPGTATIIATSESRSGSATVSVTPVPVGSVTVAPATQSLVVGTTITLASTVRDANNTIVTDRPVTWSSSNPAVATVSFAGVVTAVSVGSATITAISEGKSGSAAVTVTAVPVASVAVQPTTASLFVGQTAALSATVTDANGNVVTDRPVTWVSSNNLVATVSPAGVLTAVAPGSATITASAGGRSGSASVVVTRAPVGSVVVQPPSASLVDGQTATLTPTVKDVNGNTVTDRVVTWSSSNTLVATVSGSGVVTAVAPGTATITATSEGKSGSATLMVTPAPVGSVTVAPTTNSLRVGATATLTSTVRDANGTIVSDRAVTWSSSNPAVATVSSTGVVTAVSVGTATITATSEGKTGSAAVTVTAVPVASVTVQPPSVSLVVGQSTTLVPTVKDANGAVVTDRAVTWVSNKPSVATVSASGVVTAVAPGSAIITASSEGWNGSSIVTVTSVPVASVSLPATMTLVDGQTATLTPTVKDANGNTVTDRIVTWSSSSTSIATVSSTGAVTAVSPGTATITATSETKSGSTTLTVTPAPVGSVSVLPATATRAIGQTVQLATTVRDANGALVTDRIVSWTSSDDQIATVSSSGLVSTLGTGTATITATSETKRGTSIITVIPGPAATVTVTPTTITVANNKTVQLTASAADAKGNQITGRAFTWQTSDNRIATVTSAGMVKGVKAGAATISASLDSKSDSATVTVSP